MNKSYLKKATARILAIAIAITFMPMVTQTANAASKAPLVTKATDDYGTTTKYSYNKKGLVKKSVATSSTSTPAKDSFRKETTTYKYTKKNKVKTATTTDLDTTTSYKTDNTTGKIRGTSEGTVVEKDKSVTNYTYNKKGLATKAVTTTTETKSGSTTSTYTYLDIPDGYNIKKINDGRYRYVDDETGEIKYITEAQAAAYAKTKTSSVAYTENADGTYTTTNSNGGQPTTNKIQTVTTKDYKYKKKNVKTETESLVTTEEETFTTADGVKIFESVVMTYDPIVTNFKYKKGRMIKSSVSNPNTYSEVSVYRDTYPSGEVYETRVVREKGTVTVTDYINGVQDGEPHKYSYKEENKPITSSATFKYDKKGNLKSSKGSSTNTEDKQQMDETYNSIGVFFINAQDGETEPYMIPVSTVNSWKKTITNKVKKGSKRLLSKLGMVKGYTDGRPDGNKGEYSMGQTKFKLKSKKVAKKAAKNVELQQWMIQNGVFRTPGL